MLTESNIDRYSAAEGGWCRREGKCRRVYCCWWLIYIWAIKTAEQYESSSSYKEPSARREGWRECLREISNQSEREREKEKRRQSSLFFFSVIRTKELIVFLMLHDSIFRRGDYSSITYIDFAAAAAVYIISCLIFWNSLYRQEFCVHHQWLQFLSSSTIGETVLCCQLQ